MKFSIIIPAYNEEESIGAIVERCMAARETIVRDTPVGEVEIIVVSDGSWDRTTEIAGGFLPDIKLIAYEKNRGYGMAIKMGFSVAGGELVSFLDADGTCDPLNFAPMINKLLDENADICIGNRLGKDSRMPRVRRIGNRIYAGIVSMLGSGRVTDTASGMRVIRAASLERIYPLPDGLNFTPAMSCRAMLDDSIRIVEVPMSYAERDGESKLRVVQDGFRFLNTILDIALTYRSFRMLGSLGALFILVSLAYFVPLIPKLIGNPQLGEGMIYRVAFILAVGVGGFTLISIGLLSSRFIRLVHRPSPTGFSRYAPVFSLINQKLMGLLALLCFVAAIAINWDGIVQYATVRKVYLHWSVVMAGAFLVLIGIQMFAFAVMDRVITLMHERIGESDISEEAQRFLIKKT